MKNIPISVKIITRQIFDVEGEMKALKIGTIGVGLQGEMHIKCLKTLPNVETTAIADNKQGCGRWGRDAVR